MRKTSIFSVVCLCGKAVEFSDADRQAQCPNCKRILIVAAFPNEPLMTIPATVKHG